MEILKDQTEERELTKEEIKARKQQMLAFYNEQIDFLKVQKEFETLSADIEEARLKRLAIQTKRAELEQFTEDQDKRGSKKTRKV